MGSHKPISLPIRDARRMAVYHSGLASQTPFGKGKKAVTGTLEQLAYVQIDTISVVNRAHHHTIWNRVPGYKQEFLHQLIAKEKKVFEYWSHAAAYLPMNDYRYSLEIKQFFKDKKDRWPKPDEKLKKRVYDRVNSEGPLMARDFENMKTSGSGWWDWKPAKRALERLFLEGDLVVRERKGFQKVYDLPERYLPSHIDTSVPTNSEYARYLIKRYLNQFGLATLPEIVYQRKGIRKNVEEELKYLITEGEIVEVQLTSHNKNPYYALSENVQDRSYKINKSVRILSPFDNLIIQRKRTLEIFGFDYQIECYVPRNKRQYGYFVLPLLYGDRFVGRMDTKADRRQREFIIYNLVMEDKIKIDDLLIEELCKAIRKFVEFNNCDSIVIKRVEPAYLQTLLEKKLT